MRGVNVMANLKHRKYDKEFKWTICKMALEDNIKISDIAKQYSIKVQLIYKWISDYKTYGDEAFVGSGNLRSEDAKIKELERELEETKMELEILKKTAKYFLQKQQKE